MKSKICIGTAQFGMEYGITNNKGATSTEEISKIIRTCEKESVRYIDTAMNYGSSEKKLGECIKDKELFKLITKISGEECLDNGRFSTVKADKALRDSLARLKVLKLEGLLVHDPEVLNTHAGREILEWMMQKKMDGRICNIGISIYEKEDITENIINYIDMVQVPVSVFDQRIIRNGGIDWMFDHGIKIFARSIFLQGILLTKSISGYKLSNDLKKHHERWVKDLERKKRSQLQECVNFVASIEKIEALTIGIENNDQLSQIIQVAENVNEDYETKDTLEWGYTKINDIDPRRWRTNKEKSS